MATTGQQSAGKKSVGTLLKMEDDSSPTVFNTIGDVTGIRVSEPKFDELELTHLNSPVVDGVQYKEFTYGILDPGTITLDLNFTGKNFQDEIIAAKGTQKSFELHFPQLVTTTWTAGVKIEFEAMVGFLMPSPELKGVVKASLTLRVTGGYTFTALT